MEVLSKNIIKLDLGGANSYLIRGEKGFLLIDTGLKGAKVKLINQLKETEIEPTDISLIIITHDHYDHTGGLKEIKELTGAKVLIHEDELKVSMKSNHSSFIFRIIVNIFSKFTPKEQPECPIEADIKIDKEIDLAPYGFMVKVIHTPGHSPGSICIITNDNECFVGDTLFNMFPGTYYPIIVYDRKKLLKSYLKLEKENCSIYYPGHGKHILKEKFIKKIINNKKHMMLEE